MKVILAVDQSTSSTKAMLFNQHGELLGKTAVDHHQYYPQPGWVEHDAEEIYQNTLRAFGDLLKRNPAVKNNLLCLSLTNQRETIVIFDRKTGAPLHRAIVWQCRRGETYCSHLTEMGHSDGVQRLTGLKIDTYFPASKIKWLMDTSPNLRARLEDGSALTGTIDTYLIYRLTEGRSFLSDQTNACRTLLYDINTLTWSTTLCELFQVPRHALPEVIDSTAQFGETTLGGLLEKPIPICGVMGDSQAALFAERCFQPGMAKVTFGTGSSVLLNIGNTVRLSPNGIVTTIGWVYQGQPAYAFEGITNFTGGTITWMRDQMKLIESPQETEALAKSVPNNGGVYLIPAFVGLSAPYWQPNARAAIVGLTAASTKNHIVRAALESIAYQIRDVLDLMAADAGVALHYINGDGGMIHNHFLMQFVADITQITVRASSLSELSAFGAVMAGLLGMGVYDSLEALEGLPHHFADYAPQMESVAVQEYYAGWKAAVQRIL
ncbi:MAG: glycerol kinase GlpK [Chloroflexi bacterium]|nr:glycerol kinase GlpK [Chloroflexota bacterium]